MDFDRLISFIKFNVNRIAPKPHPMDLSIIFLMPTFKIMVLMSHSFWSNKFTKEFQLYETIWIIAKVLPSTRIFICFLHLNLKWLPHKRNMRGCRLVWPCIQLRRVLQILTSRSSSLINVDTGFNSSDLWRQFCALLTTFYSNWLIFSLNKWLQFLVKSISQERISDLKEKKTSKWLFR